LRTPAHKDWKVLHNEHDEITAGTTAAGPGTGPVVFVVISLWPL